MTKGFWEKLDIPFFALAPMADVTDAAFRFIVTKYSKYGGLDIEYDSKVNLPAEASVGGPDVMYTEFVSTDGLCSAGRENLLVDLKYSRQERPIVAQIWGTSPDKHFETAKLIRKLGFDGIDINMGCPEKKIQKQQACAALIQQPKLAQQIIKATKEGAGKLPVSVKTRIGYDRNEVETWIPSLLEAQPAAIAIHGRTKKEMSKVPAHWGAIARAAEIAKDSDVLIIGNGDVKDLADARAKAREYGVDGVMLGRAVFGNPWLFNEKVRIEDVPIKKQLKVMLEHARLYEKLFQGRKSFNLMKKHMSAYVTGFKGAKELRVKLMKTRNSSEISQLVKEYEKV